MDLDWMDRDWMDLPRFCCALHAMPLVAGYEFSPGAPSSSYCLWQPARPFFLRSSNILRSQCPSNQIGS